jgi:hypothetical protein
MEFPELTSVSKSEVIVSFASRMFGSENRFLLSQMYFRKSFAMIVFMSVVQLYSPFTFCTKKRSFLLIE